MSNAAKDSIKFRLRYKVPWGTSVYIVLNCAQTLGYPLLMQCIQLGQLSDIWQTPFIYLNQQIIGQQQQQQQQQLSYSYFTANSQNYELDRQPVYWRDSPFNMTIMDREIKRSVCKNKCIIKFDECHIRDNNVNIQEINMEKIVKINIMMVKNVAVGRWIYAMPMPDRIVGVNEGNQGDYREKQLLKAQRMSRYRTRNPEKCVWKITWIYTIQELQRLGGSHNIAFFQSYYYKRMTKHWHAILPDDRTRRSAQQLSAILQQQQIAYQIQIVDQQSGQKLQTFRHGLQQQNLIKKKIIYQVSSDIDYRRIYAVYAISEYFGRQKMGKISGKQGKLWETQVMVSIEDIDYIQALFQVNLIDEVSNAVIVANTSKYTLRNQSSNSTSQYSTYFYEKGNLDNYTIYHRNNSNNNSNNGHFDRYRGTVNHVYGGGRRTMSQNGDGGRSLSRSGSGNYFGVCNSNQQNYKYYNQTYGIFSGKIPTNSSTTSTTTNNANNNSTFSRSISLSSSTYYTNYNYNNKSVPAKRIRQCTDIKCKRNQNVKSVKYTNTRYSNNNGFGGQKNGGSSGMTSSSTSTSSITSSNYQTSFYNASSYGSISPPSSTFSSSSLSSSSKSLNSSIIQKCSPTTSSSSFYHQASSYFSNLHNLSKMDNKILQNIRVTDILQPKILLKLIKKTQIQEIVDTFQKEKQLLVNQYEQVSQCFQEAKELRKNMNKLQKQKQQQQHQGNIMMMNQNQSDVSLFRLQLMICAKRWCKNGYSDAQQSKIFKTILKYHPQLQPQPESPPPPYIHSLLLHLNSETTQKNHYQTFTQFGACTSCWQNIQLTKLFQIKQNNNPKIYTLQQIKKIPLYKNIVQAICGGSFQKIKQICMSKGIILQYDKSSQAIMRLVMYFAVFYSLGRKYLDKGTIGRFSALCGDFTPFANQTNGSFLLNQLQAVLPHFQKYIKSKQSKHNVINKKREIQQKLIQAQQKILQKVQQITGKKPTQVITIDFQLQKIKQKMQQTNKNILTINVLIDLEDSEREFIKELEHIDGMMGEENLQEERFAKIRALGQHRFLRNVQKLS